MNDIASDAASLKAWRSGMRKELIARRMAFGGEGRVHCDAAIDGHIEALLPDVAGRIVGFCWPYKAEFDPRATVLRMLARGARAALPVVIAPKTPLAFREWHATMRMEEDAYGIPVPPRTAPEVVPHVVLLPVNGFDAQGYRLGYGGGFFDRTLASLESRPIVVGISYELGRLATIYPQPHDIPLDYVVTETGAFRRAPRGLEPASRPARADPRE